MRPPRYTFHLDGIFKATVDNFVSGRAPGTETDGYISQPIVVTSSAKILFTDIRFVSTTPSFFIHEYSNVTPTGGSLIRSVPVIAPSGTVTFSVTTKSIVIEVAPAYRNLLATSDSYASVVTIPWTVHPLYSQLKKQYKRSGDNRFMRKSINGELVFKGADFDRIIQYGDFFRFRVRVNITSTGSEYVAGSFSIADCKLNYTQKEAAVSPDEDDEYSETIDHFSDEVNLFKNPPAVTRLQSTKRGIFQVYLQGTDTLMNFFGGSSYETTLTESVEDFDELTGKYAFGFSGHYCDLYLKGTNGYDGVYIGKLDEHPEVTQSQIVSLLKGWYNPDNPSHTLKLGLKLVGVAGSMVPSQFSSYLPVGYNYSNWEQFQDAYNSSYVFLYDAYVLVLLDGSDNTILQSDFFICCRSADRVKFQQKPYLGDASRGITMRLPGTAGEAGKVVSTIHYGVFSRYLVDVPSVGGTDATPLGANDFAKLSRDYHYAIPVQLGDGGINTGINQAAIAQSIALYSQPTSFGADQRGQYFIPYDGWEFPNAFSMPISPSRWVNSSLWFSLVPGNYYDYTDGWDRASRKVYDIPAFSLADVIKTTGIDVSFEGTTTYSDFLYRSSGGHKLFITPITNVTAGEGCEPATRAMLSLSSVLDLVKDLYNCYWFIDAQKRLRIEGIAYFLNGGSYTPGSADTLDLSELYDAKNKVKLSYFQAEKEFSVDELNRQYTYGWDQEVTTAFGNYDVRFFGPHIPQDQTIEIRPSKFNPDLDLMTVAPDSFSPDSFAIIESQTTGTAIPIGTVQIINSDILYQAERTLQALNSYLSWPHLFQNKLLYLDSPRYAISPRVTYPEIIGDAIVKKYGRQKISLQVESDLNEYTEVTTPVGTGAIESMTIDLDSKAAEITLEI